MSEPMSAADQEYWLRTLSELGTRQHKEGIEDLQTGMSKIKATINSGPARAMAGSSSNVNMAVGLLVLTEAFVATGLLLDGFGIPDRGHAFNAGYYTLNNDVESILDNAAADPSVWDGESAHLYAKLSQLQQELVRDVAIADQGIAAVLQEQAASVMSCRMQLIELQAAVAGAILLAVALYNVYLGALASGNAILADIYSGFLLTFSVVTASAVVSAFLYICMSSFYLHADRYKDAIRSKGKNYRNVVHELEINLPRAGVVTALAVPQSTVSDATGAVSDSQGHVPAGELTRSIVPVVDRPNQTSHQVSAFSKQVSSDLNLVDQPRAGAQRRIPEARQLTSQTYPSPSGQSKTADRNAAPAEATNATGLEGNVTPGARDTAGAAATEDVPTGLPIDLASLISTERRLALDDVLVVGHAVPGEVDPAHR